MKHITIPIIKKIISKYDNYQNLNISEDTLQRLISKNYKNLFLPSTTHKSKNNTINENYERLEFLGDSIIGFCICLYLLTYYDDRDNGFITSLKSKIVESDTLNNLAKSLTLDNYIQYNNQNKQKDFDFNKINEDVFESFIASIYLTFNSNISRIYSFICKIIESHINISSLIYYEKDFKNLLLKYYHKVYKKHPRYNIYYYYDKKTFYCCSIIVKHGKNRTLIKVKGTNKINCQKECARQALILLKIINKDNVLISDMLDCNEETDTNDSKYCLTEKDILNDKNKLVSFEIVNILLNINAISISNRIFIKRDKFNLDQFVESLTHKSYLIRLDKHENKKKNLKKIDSESEEEEEESEEGDEEDEEEEEEDEDEEEEDEKKEKYSKKKCIVQLKKTANSKLSLLGDSLLHLIIGEYLFKKFENIDQGKLSQMRKIIENRKRNVYQMALKSKIGEYVLISKNIENLGKRYSNKILTTAFVSFIGVIYLQSDYETCKKYLLNFLEPMNLTLEHINEFDDFRGRLRILCKKKKLNGPIFRILKEFGPDNGKMFTVGLYIDDSLMSKGTASSKKEAIQLASRKFLIK